MLPCERARERQSVRCIRRILTDPHGRSRGTRLEGVARRQQERTDSRVVRLLSVKIGEQPLRFFVLVPPRERAGEVEPVRAITWIALEEQPILSRRFVVTP